MVHTIWMIKISNATHNKNVSLKKLFLFSVAKPELKPIL
jgi:hypothetical protein